MSEDNKKEILGYPSTDKFEIIDTIGVPHSYMITDKHIKYSTGAYLDIEEAESKGAVCDICKELNKKHGSPILKYNEHKQALLLRITDPNAETPDKSEGIRKYLLSIADKMRADNYEGVAFTRGHSN